MSHCCLAVMLCSKSYPLSFIFDAFNVIFVCYMLCCLYHFFVGFIVFFFFFSFDIAKLRKLCCNHENTRNWDCSWIMRKHLLFFKGSKARANCMPFNTQKNTHKNKQKKTKKPQQKAHNANLGWLVPLYKLIQTIKDQWDHQRMSMWCYVMLLSFFLPFFVFGTLCLSVLTFFFRNFAIFIECNKDT